MTKFTDARAFLNHVLTSELIEGAARASHEGWLTGKQKELSGAFRGYGPKRVRVRDLSAAQRADLRIPADADPALDVYNPAYVGWADLDQDVKNKNVPPLALLLYHLGQNVLPPGATVLDLQAVLQGLVDGTDKAGILQLTMLNHIVFQCQELRTGARPYGPNARTDFPLYDNLTKQVQALDGYTLLPAAAWLLGETKKYTN